jgi:electron transport complex protein RnfG
MPKNNKKKTSTKTPLINRGPMPALILVIICSLCVTLLALTATMTEDAIAKQEQGAAGSGKQSVFPEAVEFPAETADEAIQGIPGAIPIDLTVEDFENVQGVERALDGEGQVIGVFISAATKAYHGDMPVTVGFNMDGEIVGLLVDASQETAGLGQEVGDADFTDQFIGRTTDDSFSVDFVSAATISSVSVVRSVKLASAVFDAFMGKGGE